MIIALILLVGALLALGSTIGMVGVSGGSRNILTSLLETVIIVVTMSAAIHPMSSFLLTRAAGQNIESAT